MLIIISAHYNQHLTPCPRLFSIDHLEVSFALLGRFLRFIFLTIHLQVWGLRIISMSITKNNYSHMALKRTPNHMWGQSYKQLHNVESPGVEPELEI